MAAPGSGYGWDVRDNAADLTSLFDTGMTKPGYAGQTPPHERVEPMMVFAPALAHRSGIHRASHFFVANDLQLHY
ncbi:hypothetical protein [Devosia sp. LC5]|uniref:hypothetical protein n=1 Tax=Devosia sp. LC5 TaxID=1502724 RepID=UPI001268A9F1|nr:hypothetical protein [Devosia sp. LC5]